jgi:hypothetical protein
LHSVADGPHAPNQTQTSTGRLNFQERKHAQHHVTSIEHMPQQTQTFCALVGHRGVEGCAGVPLHDSCNSRSETPPSTSHSSFSTATCSNVRKSSFLSPPVLGQGVLIQVVLHKKNVSARSMTSLNRRLVHKAPSRTSFMSKCNLWRAWRGDAARVRPW